MGYHVGLAAPAIPPPEDPESRAGFHPPTHGNWAQWAAVVLALVVGGSNIVLTLYFHSTEAATKTSDDHTNILIDAKLGPAIKEINGNTDAKLAPMVQQLKDLAEKVAKLEGRFDQLTEDQKRLARLQLQDFSQQITTAEQTGKKIDPKTVSAVGQDLLRLSESPINPEGNLAWRVINKTTGYYTSVIEVDLSGFFAISYTDQKAECIDVSRADAWLIKDALFINCTEHLDAMIGSKPVSRYVHFVHYAFKNAHIIYDGGPLELNDVYFINCTFEFRPSRPSGKLAETLFANSYIPSFSSGSVRP
jgi:hypothetical protein